MDTDGFVGFLQNKERSQNTIDTYLVGVRQFFELYNEPTVENIIAFKKSLLDKRKPKTVNIRLRGILSYCEFIGSPVNVKGIKVPRTLSVENVISPEEYASLLRGLQVDGNTRGYWIVRFLAETGARASEFVRLTKCGLLRGYDEMFTKGKIRRIYFPRNLMDESRYYFEGVQCSALFPNRFGNQLSTRGLGALLASWAGRYQIRREVMHPHSFRHFFAKEFLKNGGDLTTLSDLLGHDGLDTTAIYTRKTVKEISDEVSRRVGMIGDMGCANFCPHCGARIAG